MIAALIVLVPLLAVTAFLVAAGGSGSRADSGGSASSTSPADPPADYWHAKAVKRLKMAHRFELERNHARVVLRALRRRLHPVSYAIKLASTVYGVSEWQMHRVASCESGHNPFAVNGQYRGIYQEGSMYEAGPFGRAGFSVFDPLANALTAAYTVSRQGWKQWECRP